jgi:uncharacterized SAM-binding protein YcdF (DUF218 family)
MKRVVIVPPRRGTRWFRSALTGVVLSFIGFATAVAAAKDLLLVQTELQRADVIVVLGGDGPSRAAKAAVLYHARFSDRILVSGDGDCRDIRQLLVDAGVPAQAIDVECRSRTTFENASFSMQALAPALPRSAIVVTSWFHTRRALACFEKVAPGVRWMAAPAKSGEPFWRVMWEPDGMAIAKEYVKIGWYVVRHAVPLMPHSAGGTQPGAAPALIMKRPLELGA